KILPRLKQRTAQEWFAEALRRKIPIVPVPEIADLIADEEKRGRGATVPIEIGEERGFTAGSMQRLLGTPPRRGGKGPAVGEKQGDVPGTPAPPKPAPAAAAGNNLPL